MSCGKNRAAEKSSRALFVLLVSFAPRKVINFFRFAFLHHESLHAAVIHRIPDPNAAGDHYNKNECAEKRIGVLAYSFTKTVSRVLNDRAQSAPYVLSHWDCLFAELLRRAELRKTLVLNGAVFCWERKLRREKHRLAAPYVNKASSTYLKPQGMLQQ